MKNFNERHTIARVRQSQAGFTVAELLVSISIFAVVATVAVSIFIQVLRSQRSIVALLNVSDNAAIAIEQMMREIRFGRGFSVFFGRELSFTNQENKEVRYRYDSASQAIQRAESAEGFFDVTADNIIVKDFNISMVGGAATRRPARVTISLTIASDKRDVKDAEVVIQTTVSQRQVSNILGS